jgi:hypothetical protein
MPDGFMSPSLRCPGLSDDQNAIQSWRVTSGSNKAWAGGRLLSTHIDVRRWYSALIVELGSSIGWLLLGKDRCCYDSNSLVTCALRTSSYPYHFQPFSAYHRVEANFGLLICSTSQRRLNSNEISTSTSWNGFPQYSKHARRSSLTL